MSTSSVSSRSLSSRSLSLGVIILAGGYSRRMGTDKALLILSNGQSLIDHTAQVAQRLSSEVLVVTPWPERYQATLPTSIRLITEVHPPPDPAFCQRSSQKSSQKPSAGPLSGFIAGWQHLSTDWCLLLACDLPNLDGTVLQQWWAWIQAQSALGWPLLTSASSASLASGQPMASLVPMLKGRRSGWEPLCGYYHRSCLSSLTQQLSAHQRAFQPAFQPWLSTLCIARYNHVPPQMLRNCNTPAEWAAVNQSDHSI